jgi:hypothetical protein
MSDQTSSGSAAGRNVAESLAAAVASLRKAADELSRRSSPPPPEPLTAKENPSPPGREQDDRKAYYRSLQRRGVLVDVDEDVDLASLPPSVTHVRFADGRVQRVGYS